jgi:hypothetical protein
VGALIHPKAEVLHVQKYFTVMTSVIKCPVINRLGGVVVSGLATGAKGCGFEHGQGDGFLRPIKSAAHIPFGWEVKLECPMS